MYSFIFEHPYIKCRYCFYSCLYTKPDYNGQNWDRKKGFSFCKMFEKVSLSEHLQTEFVKSALTTPKSCVFKIFSKGNKKAQNFMMIS
jgi:hypothetical protein